jgi:hypothetical protein
MVPSAGYVRKPAARRRAPVPKDITLRISP